MVFRLMKDEVEGKIMKGFVVLRTKAYSYLLDDGSEDKTAKGTEMCVIKTKTLKFKVCKIWLEAAQILNKPNHLEKHRNWCR